MSKDNANFRLLGSPVNLSYRSKRKEDRRNRNRPRSALQNSITPENQERFKRPFSADTKDRGPSTRSFLKSFSADLLQSYNNSPTTVRILPPTEKLLTVNQLPRNSKEICSNASDYGSEDTFISLGTKIKAKAQSGPKGRTANPRNHLKYKNIAKKGRRGMDNTINEDANHDYGLEIKITERSSRTPSPSRSRAMFDQRSPSPTFKNRSCESYFIPFEDASKVGDGLTGRVSFGPKNDNSDVERVIDNYARRLSMTKQQLSLVEEESTQDLESIPSHNMISLTPENSLVDVQSAKELTSNKDGEAALKTYVENIQTDDFGKNSRPFVNETQNYSKFYSEFQANTSSFYQPKMSSTLILTDASSKDSGYTESGLKEDKSFIQNYSLPSTSFLRKSNSQEKITDQPKSLDSVSSNSNDKSYSNIHPSDKKWVEPLNHSRLLYKDFFIRKEDKPIPPQNTPVKSDIQIPGISEFANSTKNQLDDDNLQYPSYLVNSSTKAYTSKVIEDYKNELKAIDNLHDLTIKDIKTDAISPTPLNIDKMFEEHSYVFTEHKQDLSDNSQESTNTSDDMTLNDKNALGNTKKDISKVTTKELIQNYLKVKSDYAKDNTFKNLRRNERKVNKPTSKMEENPNYKQDWNNRANKNTVAKGNVPVNIRNQTQPQKNAFSMRAPLSARIESVQNDKDIDSWMSLSAPSPRILELDKIESLVEEPLESHPKSSDRNTDINDDQFAEIKSNPTPKPPSPVKAIVPKATELNTKSTVLDIYSMLKEIESYGDGPVVTASNINTATSELKEEERNTSPKDNFMEIFEFLEKVEQSANDALSVVTSTTPQNIPKLEALLKLPQTELAQRLVTASLQLEERSCCIALLQESLTNHKEQMINKVSNLEKQSNRNIAKVKQECEETIKRHQNFIDQLINDKKTLNHRIEQLVDERRSLEERWKRSAQALEDRYKLELRNQHDKMAAAQQVARQRWVRQKAEKIKELTVKGLEGELREMAERQQKDISDLKMFHAEQIGRANAKHAAELEELRRSLEQEKEAALVKERQLASSRLEKQILELELTYQEQRTRLIADMRAENDRAAAELTGKEKAHRQELDKWKEEQEKMLQTKRSRLEEDILKEKEKLEEQIRQKSKQMEEEFEQYKKDYEAEQQVVLKKKVTEIAAQHKQERDREIEKAIESMEAEAQAGRKDLQEALRRNKEQYEAELKELGETEQATLKRYQDAQARIRQTEDRCAELEVTISQLETRNRILTEKNIQLETRAEETRVSCEESWRSKVDSLKKEMEDMKKTHEEQMHQLYAKVKVAVARKDSAIQALTREAGKYQEKITLLEQKLQQQRKDFLKHK
ncbi:uncharacterized protein dila [Epargyreus clarus]|uniref:uncharacterized protein dila n=1 Tax=Epargyreus clarus TaxID=520877 RepID=UPI003C2F929B